MALVASELSTPVDMIEAWPVRKLLVYHGAAVRLLRAKAGKPVDGERNLPGGRATVKEQADAVLNAAFAKQRRQEPDR